MLPAIGGLFGSLEITDFRCNWCRLQLMAIGLAEYSSFTVVKTIICVWQQKEPGRGRRGAVELDSLLATLWKLQEFHFFIFSLLTPCVDYFNEKPSETRPQAGVSFEAATHTASLPSLWKTTFQKDFLESSHCKHAFHTYCWLPQLWSSKTDCEKRALASLRACRQSAAGGSPSRSSLSFARDLGSCATKRGPKYSGKGTWGPANCSVFAAGASQVPFAGKFKAFGQLENSFILSYEIFYYSHTNVRRGLAES